MISQFRMHVQTNSNFLTNVSGLNNKLNNGILGQYFHFEEVFCQIEHDIIDMKVKYNLPICLAGDFNVHTGIKSDFLDQDNLLADLLTVGIVGEDIGINCSPLNGGFTTYR